VPPVSADTPFAALVRDAEKLGVHLDAATIARCERYADLLIERNTVVNLTAITEPLDIARKHFLDSFTALAVRRWTGGERVVDVGSGAGLPGIPLGLARPDVRVTLVEPMARRIEFLEEVLPELPDDGRWRIVRGRAEDRSVAGAVGPVDVVTARAVAPLPRLVAWCRRLMRPGTQLVALVGARALDELPGLVPQLEAAGMRNVRPRAVGAALGDAATTVVVMTRGAR
jgi:16S rRNA (guanine527-N7)-methyltransferase